MLRNIVWDYSGRLTIIILNLIVTAILSRLLNSHDYGVIGLVMAVTAITNVFQDFGLNSSIIQKNDINQNQLSTVFYTGILVGVFLYVVVFLTSKKLGLFYEVKELSFIIKISSISIIINAFNLVPSALIQKKMQFKQQTIRSVLVSVLVGLVAIYMAYNNYGVWALVFQSLIGVLFGVGINFYISGWIPSINFNIKEIRPLMAYSKYIFYSSLVNIFFGKIDSFLIGKLINLSTLGQYTRSQGMDNLVRGISSSSILSVLFPYFSKIQNDDNLISQQWQKFYSVITFLYFLISGIAFISAKLIFYILFGKNWGAAASYYQIMSLFGFVYPLSGLASSILEAKGKSRDYFRLELTKKAIILPFLFLIFYCDLTTYIIILNCTYFLTFLITLVFLKKIIYFNIFMCIKQVFGSLAILFSFYYIFKSIGKVFLFESLNIENVIVMNTLFVLYYLLFSIIVQPEAIRYLGNKIQKKIDFK